MLLLIGSPRISYFWFTTIAAFVLASGEGGETVVAAITAVVDVLDVLAGCVVLLLGPTVVETCQAGLAVSLLVLWVGTAVVTVRVPGTSLVLVLILGAEVVTDTPGDVLVVPNSVVTTCFNGDSLRDPSRTPAEVFDTLSSFLLPKAFNFPIHPAGIVASLAARAAFLFSSASFFAASRLTASSSSNK